MIGGCECWVDELCNHNEMLSVGCLECKESATTACAIYLENSSIDEEFSILILIEVS